MWNDTKASYVTNPLKTDIVVLACLWVNIFQPRNIKLQMHKDIFNEENETFPQKERLPENEFSINLPARY